MRKFIAASALMCVAVVGSLAAAALPNYAGIWTLDRDKSSGLPPNMAVGFELVVTQNAQKITVETMGSQVPYNLDGSKEKVQVTGRRGLSEATTYLEKMDDGKIVLHTEREVNIQGTPTTIKTTETWALADGGKSLKVHRSSEGGPRGPQSSELVFILKS